MDTENARHLPILGQPGIDDPPNPKPVRPDVVRRSRRKHAVPSKSINVRYLTKRALREGREQDAFEAKMGIVLPLRPATRRECEGQARPCPFVSCRHHLYLDVGAKGTLKLNFPDLEPQELEESCSLDVAESEGETLERIGELMNLTRERVRTIAIEAKGKVNVTTRTNQKARATLLEDRAGAELFALEDAPT